MYVRALHVRPKSFFGAARAPRLPELNVKKWIRMMTLVRGYALSKDATVQGTILLCAAGVAPLPRAKSTTSIATRLRYAPSKDAAVPRNTKMVATGIDAARVA